MKNKKTLIIIISLMVIVLGICGFKYQQQQKQYKEYQTKLNKVQNEITIELKRLNDMCIECEETEKYAFDNGIVWSEGKAISGVKAIMNWQVGAYDKQGKYYLIDSNKKDIDKDMKSIENPPNKYKTEYEKMIGSYNIYLKGIKTVKSPYGENLKNMIQDINEILDSIEKSK